MISRHKPDLFKRSIKASVLVLMIAIAGHGHAATGVVPPALAACSKALIETLAKPEAMPTYTVKAPRAFVPDNVDPNAYTVIARTAKTRQLLAKASCKATPTGEIVSFRTIPIKS
jgi:hypothetical protein